MPTVSVEGLSEGNNIELTEGEVLFNGLEDNGVKLPHGCLSGSCGACKIEVLKGSELLKKPSLIENETIESIKSSLTNKGIDCSDKTIRLSCRAKIESNGDILIRPI